MTNQAMSPELVRIVHERQIIENARRREIDRLVGPRDFPAIRRAVGAALVRAGRAIGGEPVAVARVVPIRPGIRFA